VSTEWAQEVDEVTRLSDEYEAALRRNDVAVLDGLFADDPRVLRFGLGDMQRGRAQIVEWRASAPPISPGRVVTSRDVAALADGIVAVDLTFVDDDPSWIGRQSQTWIRLDVGWRIVRAHVSLIRS
jgi:hypothetical protein